MNKLKIPLSAACLLIVYALFLEPFHIRITTAVIDDDALSPFFTKYKTIFLSDIHVSTLGIREKRLLSKIKELAPDIIFLSGDYVTWNGNYQRTFDFLKELKAAYGVYGVLGDSDYTSSRKSCLYCHAFEKNRTEFSIRFLKNRSIVIGEPGYRIKLAGIETFHHITEQEQKDLTGDNRFPQIILSHKQIRLDSLPDQHVLILSGDTHGGQVYLPDIVWRKAFGKTKGPVRRGFVEDGKKSMYVSRGIGTSMLPMRFFCPPEIVLFKGKV